VLRITMVRAPGGDATLRVEGRLVGRWVDEVARLYAEARRAAPVVGLDLTGVSFLDREAIGLLNSLRSEGVAVEGGSPFVREQLEGGTDVGTWTD
jgi:hypothetical protein